MGRNVAVFYDQIINSDLVLLQCHELESFSFTASLTMNVYDQESHSKRYRFLASIISSSASLFSLNVSIHNIFLILFTHEQYR